MTLSSIPITMRRMHQRRANRSGPPASAARRAYGDEIRRDIDRRLSQLPTRLRGAPFGIKHADKRHEPLAMAYVASFSGSPDSPCRCIVAPRADLAQCGCSRTRCRHSRPPVGERQESDRLLPHGIVTSMMAQGDNLAVISAARASVVLRIRS
jgi:hypothetical protein